MEFYSVVFVHWLSNGDGRRASVLDQAFQIY
jgi:hypothetical protein